jgi:hypothetical protein
VIVRSPPSAGLPSGRWTARRSAESAESASGDRCRGERRVRRRGAGAQPGARACVGRRRPSAAAAPPRRVPSPDLGIRRSDRTIVGARRPARVGGRRAAANPRAGRRRPRRGRRRDRRAGAEPARRIPAVRLRLPIGASRPVRRGRRR